MATGSMVTRAQERGMPSCIDGTFVGARLGPTIGRPETTRRAGGEALPLCCTLQSCYTTHDTAQKLSCADDAACQSLPRGGGAAQHAGGSAAGGRSWSSACRTRRARLSKRAPQRGHCSAPPSPLSSKDEGRPSAEAPTAAAAWAASTCSTSSPTVLQLTPHCGHTSPPLPPPLAASSGAADA